MRGLKPLFLSYRNYNYVASFTDAWIETGITVVGCHTELVASFTDAWIETYFDLQERTVYLSHLLQMRGLKLVFLQEVINYYRRIFYRCVD